ncbi:MAG TPA: DUF222 domain-containing protein [Micromonosporaceae bacterium]|nr:DUF222 domain-containing protein [Micromonosporaceae bacterium]
MVAQRSAVAKLADTPPGPRLAALVDSLDLARLSGSDCVEVLRAHYRQATHERGLFLAAVAEVVLRDEADGVGRTGEPSEFAFDEVRAALTFTRRAADAVCALAHRLAAQLPRVLAAMVAGVLDEPRARIFAEWTVGLADRHAQAVCAVLLPQAAGWTTGQLIEQIKRSAIALDPQWARRRYEQAVAGRRVVGSLNPDGSANLAGYDLPAGSVAAACARIDALAKAAKRAGRPDRLDHLRAELFLGMTDGTFAGLDDAAVLALLTADPGSAPDPGPATAHAGAAADEEWSLGSASAADPVSAPDPAADPADRATAADGDAGEEWPLGSASAADAVSAPGPVAAVDPAAAADPADRATVAGGDVGEDRPVTVGRRGGRGVEVQVRLSTLLGRDRCPAELAGWGPIHAELAQTIVAEHGGGRWRFVVTDPAGYPVAVGVLRRRPASSARTGRDGVVEVQVPEPTLRALAG